MDNHKTRAEVVPFDTQTPATIGDYIIRHHDAIESILMVMTRKDGSICVVSNVLDMSKLAFLQRVLVRETDDEILADLS